MTGRILVVVGVAVTGIAIALLVATRRAPTSPALDARAPAVAQVAQVDAPRAAAPPPVDAAAIVERERVLATLAASGSGSEPWVAQGMALLDSLAHRGVEITGAGCYVAGCGATVTFPSEADYRRSIAELESSAAYRAWTGGKRLTAPQLGADGRVTIALALYRPD